jgi:tetratricopeptide (TPR) repeat protein
MNEARINLLKNYIEEEPNAPFNYYALACEYLNGKEEEALQLFEKLLSDFPDYLATYYQAAQLLEEFEEEERALAVYQKGIQLAQAQNNVKTLNELRVAKQNLEFEMD